MTQDFSIIHLLLNASWVVQAVVLLLMGVSVASWTAIFRKAIALKQINALLLQLSAHGWVDTCIAACDTVAGRTRNQREPSHESATDT